MEADDVRASHLPERGFQKNPDYAPENERRYHDESASRDKVLRNAMELDPSFLIDSVDANHGAPVVDHDGNVLGGNGRAMSISLAYERFPERAAAYRAAIRERAESLGLNPADVDAMRRPVLTRRLDREMDAGERQSLVSALNDTFTDSRNARASGKSRGDRLGRRTLEALGAGLAEADSLRDFFDMPQSVGVVDMLIDNGVIQPAERNAFLNRDGMLNPDGKRVVEEALRGRVARSYDALASLPGPVMAKIDAAIPHLLVAERVGGEWDITRHMRDAIDLLAEFRASNSRDVEIFLFQRDLSREGYATPSERFSRAAQTLFRAVLDMKKREFVQMFARYAGQARMSIEANGLPGIGMTAKQAQKEILGFDDAGKTGGETGGGKPASEGVDVEGVNRSSPDKPAYPNNGRVVGRISDDMATALPRKQAGDIVLDDRALRHIEERHGEELRKLGFADAGDFVDFVLKHMDAVYAVPHAERKYDIVSRARKPQGRVMTRLEFAEGGDHYQIVTAGTVRKNYYEKRTPLWESANLNHSTSGTPDAVSGQSGVRENVDASSSEGKADQRQDSEPARKSQANNTVGERQAGDGNVALASIAPGEHLPPAGNARRGMRTDV
ncbi:hypothetical protein, partial [uncultured Desulfovibrio sp.]|uniref:hypothetical protein n=1 Tax=uncultured Desulfovibrio sp. TaxID=167968 RepID=UPI00261018B8